jgi:hypothetical protein
LLFQNEIVTVRLVTPKLLIPACLVGLTVIVAAQSPVVNYSIPSALTPGKTTTLTLVGENLDGATELWTSFPAEVVRDSASNSNATDRVTYRVSVPGDAPLGVGALRLATTRGISAMRMVAIDDLPSIADSGTNKAVVSAQEIGWRTAVDGGTDDLGSDYFQISGRAGQLFSAEVVAQRLGFDLDPVLRLLDAAGHELAFCDDAGGLQSDAQVHFQFSQAGQYFLEVRDTRYRGGSKYRYRLRVGEGALTPLSFLPARQSDFHPAWFGNLPETTEIEPNSTVATATQIKVPGGIAGRFAKPNDKDFYEFEVQAGQRLVLAGKTRTLGSPCDLFMRLYKADQSLISEANITGTNEGTITNRFDEAGTYRLLVEELNRLGGPDLAYRIDIKPITPGFALSVDSDKFEVTAGGSVEIKVACLRNNYDGPITLVLNAAGKGLELSNNIILGKTTNETPLKVTAPANLAGGRLFHFTIIGYARIGESYFESQASTMPALRKLFPQMLYPPEDLDGLIGLGVKAAEKPAPAAAPKTSQLNPRRATGKNRRT